jgi:hypothetical protein
MHSLANLFINKKSLVEFRKIYRLSNVKNNFY